jgi:hypothetical protein
LNESDFSCAGKSSRIVERAEVCASRRPFDDVKGIKIGSRISLGGWGETQENAHGNGLWMRLHLKTEGLPLIVRLNGDELVKR